MDIEEFIKKSEEIANMKPVNMGVLALCADLREFMKGKVVVDAALLKIMVDAPAFERDWTIAEKDAARKIAEAVYTEEDGPGEEDGPWAEGWSKRSGLNEYDCSMCKDIGTIASGFAVRPCPKCSDSMQPASSEAGSTTTESR